MNDSRQEAGSLTGFLAGNPYPGRGLALGLTPDGKRAVSVYFIMGRSQNSRNRVFAPTGDGIRTQAYDESLVEDPSLIIYRAVRTCIIGNQRLTIVTNGDQTDTIYEGLQNGLSFEEALRERTFEPDAPNYTPRISGLLEIGGDGGVSHRISILKTKNGDPKEECRGFYDYQPAEPGTGHFISTYVTDGSPLPSFEGAPKTFEVPDDVEDWAGRIWQALDRSNRISLYVRAEEIADGSVWECVINAHEE